MQHEMDTRPSRPIPGQVLPNQRPAEVLPVEARAIGQAGVCAGGRDGSRMQRDAGGLRASGFGAPSIGTRCIDLANRKRKPGVQWSKHDCGSYGHLTLPEIAAQAGITVNAARYRVRALKLSGDALVEGTQALRKRSVGSIVKSPSILIACKLARAYPDTVPTWREVQKIVPMCEQAAKRWSRAMEAAK